MQYEGVLQKMPTEIGSPIQYYMIFEGDFLNQFYQTSVFELW